MAQTLNFNGVEAETVTFNGVVIDNVYFNTELVFSSAVGGFAIDLNGEDEGITIPNADFPATVFDIDFEGDLEIQGFDVDFERIFQIGSTFNIYELHYMNPTTLRSRVSINNVLDDVFITIPTGVFNFKIESGNILLNNVIVGAHNSGTFGAGGVVNVFRVGFNHAEVLASDMLIHNFRYLTEVFPCDEGTGLTVTGSEGTIGVIETNRGNAVWIPL